MESTVLVKAFGLLESIAATGGGRPLGVIAQEAGLTKPTAHRILHTLIGLGYVERPETGVYRLGLSVRRLTGGLDENRLVAAAESALHHLNEQTGESVNLGVLRNGRVVYLRTIEGTHALRLITGGDEDPFYCTAMGRVIVGQYQEPQRELLLRNVLREKRTEKTVVDTEELREILQQAGKDGFSVEIDQTDLGVTCVGVPVFKGDQVIGAISLSAPTVRVSADRQMEYVDLLKRAASEISHHRAQK